MLNFQKEELEYLQDTRDTPKINFSTLGVVLLGGSAPLSQYGGILDEEVDHTLLLPADILGSSC